MPELPEVHTITSQLNQVLPGKQISGIKILKPKKILIHPADLIGQTIARLRRQAKIIIIDFVKPGLHLIIHLKMTGQLIYQNPQNKRIAGGHPTKDWLSNLPVKSTKVIFSFDDGSRLFFNDQRGFGWLKQVRAKDLSQNLRNFQGVEPLTPNFTPKRLYTITSKTSRSIKNLLHDQTQIAGLGNIYINDALWLAKIHPLTPASKLTKTQTKKLHQAINQVIKEAIQKGGASDNTYINAFGLAGAYQENFKVYRRQGQPCHRHKTTLIKRIKIAGRSGFFCPKCQKPI
ncbi:MAG: bifunctional DNA-formamidopyrimidine glycosylase/DNA-(apurinic or apyrimidinic site) lyase [bacterium]|nr:bifunctional DNA-formamidopyrimidine glycosylase/DNA-(apurinic or apyrimidinic site) lyase [bacterium]